MTDRQFEHFIGSDDRPDLCIDLDAKIGDMTPAQIQSILAAYNPAIAGRFAAAVPVAIVVIIAVPGAGKILKDEKDFVDEKRDRDTKGQKDSKDGKDGEDSKSAQDRKQATDRKNEKDSKDVKDAKDNPDTENRKNTKDRADTKQTKDNSDQKLETDQKTSRDDKAVRESQKNYDDKPSKDSKDFRDASSTPGVASADIIGLLDATTVAAAGSMTLRDLFTRIGLNAQGVAGGASGGKSG